MNILIINTLDQGGGAANVAWSLRGQFVKAGHNVKMIVAMKSSDDKDVYEIKKNWFLEKLEKITKKNFSQFLKDKKAFLLSNDIDFIDNENLLQHPFYKNADIVHCHNLHGNYFNLKNLIKISKTKKVVWTLHDMWAFTGRCAHSFGCENWQDKCGGCEKLKTYPAYFRDNTKKILNKKKEIYKQSKLKIVCPSGWLLKKVKKSILKNQELCLIPNGIDSSIFQFNSNKKELRKKLGLSNNTKIISFSAPFGKSNPWKGAEFAYKLAENNPEVTFINIGGVEDSELDNLISTKYITNQNEFADYLNASDVFLFPSLAENFPLVTLEAMSCGLPIVSFDVGGMKEQILHKQTGYIAEYKNFEDLQKGLDWILRLSDSEYNTVCKSSRDFFNKNFTIEKQANEYLKLFG